ncbi:SGNH/GDSL hydrolase family protein [Yoonia sp. 208BN28-4]|uniref:SGNH/GDSL hydrolase family protein n=1 Tax=Yoonia sp. 208BN28-4 TaxID=3126505 RepID=UPI00309D78A6
MSSARHTGYHRPILPRIGWWLVAIVLSPLLAIQIIYTLHRTPSMPEPPGARKGVTGYTDAPRVRVLILGDSSAAGVGVDHQQDALSGQLVRRLVHNGWLVQWQTVAKIGARTRDTVERLRDADVDSVDVVVIGLGVNDATHLIPERRWLNETADLLDLIAEKLDDPIVLFSGFPPIGRFPAMTRPLRNLMGWRADLMDRSRQGAFADLPSVIHMPFDMPLTAAHMAMDGFHPGPEVYDKWAEVAVQAWHSAQARRPIDVDGWTA